VIKFEIWNYDRHCNEEFTSNEILSKLELALNREMYDLVEEMVRKYDYLLKNKDKYFVDKYDEVIEVEEE